MIIIIFTLLKGSCVLRKQLVTVMGKAGRSIPVYKLFLSQIGQCKRWVHNSESRREKIVIVRDMTFSFSSGSSLRESPGESSDMSDRKLFRWHAFRSSIFGEQLYNSLNKYDSSEILECEINEKCAKYLIKVSSY